MEALEALVELLEDLADGGDVQLLELEDDCGLAGNFFEVVAVLLNLVYRNSHDGLLTQECGGVFGYALEVLAEVLGEVGALDDLCVELFEESLALEFADLRVLEG